MKHWSTWACTISDNSSAETVYVRARSYDEAIRSLKEDVPSFLKKGRTLGVVRLTKEALERAND